MVKNIIKKNENIDIEKEKLNKIKEIFPNCFNNNGDFDIENFKNEIGKNTNVIKEGYSLNFLGKNYAKLLASLDTETILVPDEENNSKEENKNSENIYISGDNIDALKHLVKSYTNKIKCIYIDPPYNTDKGEFIYNDKFNFSIEKLINDLDIAEDEAERIYNMTNSKSNSHSAWLTFMYPRLYLAKQLLTEDGVIFISIDDNEQSQLKLLMDNIFGEENSILIGITNRTSEIATDKTILKHEYILLYGKDINHTKLNGEKKFTVSRGTVGNVDQTMPEITFPKGISCYNIPDGVYETTRKIENSLENIENLTPIIVENGKLKEDIILKARWRSSNDMRNFFANGMNPTKAKISGEIVEIYFENEKFNPQIKKDTCEKISSLYLDNKRGSKDLEDLNINYFSFPKSVSYLKYLLKFMDNDSIILDFFSGSATTAHACMQLNAEDGGNRKYIMVQLSELCDKNSEAYKNGYKTIDEIGQERIRRAAKKIKEETNADIDYGFKHYFIKEVDTNTLDKLEKFEPSYIYNDSNILDEFGITSVLTTWLEQDGYGLTDKYQELDLDGYTAYTCENTIYLINPNLESKYIKTLIEKYEKEDNFTANRIVLFGYSFNLNEIQTLKDNLKQVKNIKDISVDVITRY